MICGEEVGLRLVSEEDLQLLARWREDPLTSAMFHSPFLMSDAALRDWHTALLTSSNKMRFMIERLEDKATIGIIGLENIEHRNQVAELAGLVIDPVERGRGWATKSVTTLIRYAFEDLNLHRLFARIYGSNRAAQCVAENAGLQSEGVARQSVFHNWNYEDVVYMAILREEWNHEPAATATV